MAEKISPQEARQEVQSGKALLVCAYEDEERYKKVRLEGAISLKEFRNKEQDLSKDQEIIFYCAWHNDATSARVAESFEAQGFSNVKVLAGGVNAWINAGYPVL